MKTRTTTRKSAGTEEKKKKKKGKKKKKQNQTTTSTEKTERDLDELESINPLRRRGRGRRERSRVYDKNDDDDDEVGIDRQRGRRRGEEKRFYSFSSSSSSSSGGEDDDDSDKNKAAEDILLENSRRMRFNDTRRKRELFAQVEREQDTLMQIQREKAMKAYLDQEMVDMKKKLTIESALNEEEDEERTRNAEMAAETLCKSLDEADCFTRENIDWDDHEQKWAKFDAATTCGGKEAEGEQNKISMSDIPWPPSKDILQHMAAFEMRQKGEREEFEDGSRAERKAAAAEKIHKKAFRRANLRWHPDKFTAKYGKYLDENDRDAILERVEEISMTVNSSFEKLMTLA